MPGPILSVEEYPFADRFDQCGLNLLPVRWEAGSWRLLRMGSEVTLVPGNSEVTGLTSGVFRFGSGMIKELPIALSYNKVFTSLAST